jgi:uncharacterized heparinase superfamily protein
MRGPVAMLRYWHTVRHLKPGQVIGRVSFRLARPKPDLSATPPRRLATRHWSLPPARPRSWFDGDSVRFLGVEHRLAEVGWDGPGPSKLWRYNLHYFDDLLAADASARHADQRDAIGRWVLGNPPARGTGWEPYPTSLRIVNWIKWSMGGGCLDGSALHSLAVQSRWLLRRLEWHLLGNHLFVNAKALVFAGCFFEGPEASRWLARGTEILLDQLPEQILPDGGQFERSPMYHALALEDVLDLLNMLAAHGMCDGTLAAALRERVGPMCRWLGIMSHPDGEIAFFNDAAFGIAPSPVELDAYAARLGFPPFVLPAGPVTLLPDSGYVRMQLGPAVVIADVGPVGPDYLPGHAHADTLSFELSLCGQRLIVNSGTSEYGTGPERLRQRGTAAHNTLSIDGADSSEVWGGFRVARRARAVGLSVQHESHRVDVRCAHDGYRRLHRRPTHHRRWVMDAGGLEVHDEVPEAPGRASVHLHWAPGARCGVGGEVTLGGLSVARMSMDGATWHSVASTWHPRFGRVVSNEAAVARIPGTACILRLRWT